MGLLQKIFGRVPEQERRSLTSWDLLGGDRWPSEAGVAVGPHMAENLAAVFACVEAIAGTIGRCR